MKSTSIRTKVLLALSVCLVAGVTGTLVLMHYSFEQNAQALGAQSVKSSQKLFGILEAREASKMTAVSEALIANPELRGAYESKDRAKLLGLCKPIYATLKEQGITNWVFHTAEPDMSVFLRVHNPDVYGDQLDRFLTRESARTKHDRLNQLRTRLRKQSECITRTAI